MERDALDLVAVVSERVEIAFALLAPVHELDAELKGTPDRGQHVRVLDADQLVESQEWRDRGLTDEHGTVEEVIVGLTPHEVTEDEERTHGYPRMSRPITGSVAKYR